MHWIGFPQATLTKMQPELDGNAQTDVVVYFGITTSILRCTPPYEKPPLILEGAGGTRHVSEVLMRRPGGRTAEWQRERGTGSRTTNLLSYGSVIDTQFP